MLTDTVPCHANYEVLAIRVIGEGGGDTSSISTGAHYHALY